MSRRKRVRLDKGGRAATREKQPAAQPASEPTSQPGCDCPELEPADWDGVESDWSDIQFVRVHAIAAWGVPVGFSGLRKRLESAAASAGGTIPRDAMLLLGAGKFRRPVMMEVEDADPGARGVTMPGGVVYTRLLKTPWSDMAANAKQTTGEAQQRFGRDPDNLWVWYLTCTECSSERDYETLFVAHYRDDPARSS